MSKMGRYIQWCMDEGYTNEMGDVDSMDHVDEYKKYQERFRAICHYENPRQEEEEK